MKFTAKSGVKSCTYCSFENFEVVEKEIGYFVTCTKCGEADYIVWNGKRWEGEKERYEVDKCNY